MAYQHNLSNVQMPATVSITLADATKAYELLLPAQCRRVILEPKTNAALVAYSGTAGVALGDNAMSHDAALVDEWPIDPPGASLFLQTAMGGSKVAVCLLGL